MKRRNRLLVALSAFAASVWALARHSRRIIADEFVQKLSTFKIRTKDGRKFVNLEKTNYVVNWVGQIELQIVFSLTDDPLQFPLGLNQELNSDHRYLASEQGTPKQILYYTFKTFDRKSLDQFQAFCFDEYKNPDRLTEENAQWWSAVRHEPLHQEQHT